MKVSAIALATSLALLLAGSAWAGRDEAKAKAGDAGKAAEQQSEKAMERSNAQWKDSAQKGAERADSVKSDGKKAMESSNAQLKGAAQKGTEQADAVKSEGEDVKNEVGAQAEKLGKAPGKRDEGALDQ
jgi:hypothetical protein